MSLSREIYVAPMIVFVDGLTRTGKSMLGPILASFDRVEIEQVEEIIEYIGVLYGLGKIECDAAVSMLRMKTDMLLYNSCIGRNTNFRFTDHSSVWRNPNPWRYFRRIFGPERGTVLRLIQQKKPIYQNQTHDQLMNFDLHYAAFGDRLRIAEMIRDPVDLIHSWIQRGWGERFGVDPLALTFCERFQGHDVPYYALDWEGLYVTLPPLARVIRMIAGLWDNCMKTYRALAPAQQKQILIIPFERFVQNPQPYLAAIAGLLGSHATRYTARELRRQRCPRPYDVTARDRKYAEMLKQVSEDERCIMRRLIEEYEALLFSNAGA